MELLREDDFDFLIFFRFNFHKAKKAFYFVKD